MKILNKAEIEAAEKVLLKHLPKSFKVVLILKGKSRTASKCTM